jgi:hypothetical protein
MSQGWRQEQVALSASHRHTHLVGRKSNDIRVEGQCRCGYRVRGLEGVVCVCGFSFFGALPKGRILC